MMGLNARNGKEYQWKEIQITRGNTNGKKLETTNYQSKQDHQKSDAYCFNEKGIIGDMGETESTNKQK